MCSNWKFCFSQGSKQCFESRVRWNALAKKLACLKAGKRLLWSLACWTNIFHFHQWGLHLFLRRKNKNYHTHNASQSQDGGFLEVLFAVCPETWVALDTATVQPKCKLTLDSRFSQESRIESRYSTQFSIRDSRKNCRRGTFPIMQTWCRLRENDLFLLKKEQSRPCMTADLPTIRVEQMFWQQRELEERVRVENYASKSNDFRTCKI